jgi:hypothetical protein
MTFEAKKYRAYARECLLLAEKADRVDVREKLIDLSRIWTEAAVNEESHSLKGSPATGPAQAR